MECKEYLSIIHVLEKLKNVTRHCDTSCGRRESVAEHCWRLAMMAYLLRDEFPDTDNGKLIRMCLAHDLGEIFTGDIPVFRKTEEDEKKEAALLDEFFAGLPDGYKDELRALMREIDEGQTREAKIFRALDGFEALIQHNEAPLSSWEPHEIALQRTFGYDRAAGEPFLEELRREIRNESEEKLRG